MKAMSHGTRAGMRSGTRATSVVMSRSDSLSGSGPYLLAIGALRVDAGKIGGARARALLCKRRVVALARPLFPGRAFDVGEVAERDRLRRARLLASRLYLTVANAPIVDVGRDGRRFDALDAVGALFLDATATY